MEGVNKTYRNIFDYSEHFAHKNDSLECKKLYFNTSSDGSFFPSEKVLNPSYVSLKESGHYGVKRFQSIEQVDGIFVLLLLCFILLVYILRRGLSFFKQNIRSFFSLHNNVSYFNEVTVGEFWSGFLLIFQTVFLYSIVIFVFLFESGVPHNPEYIFTTVIGFVILIFLFELPRYLLYRFVGYLFELQRATSAFIRFYNVVIEILGVVAFIPVLLLIYFDYYHNVLFVFFALLFIISRLIIIYRVSIFFLQKNVNILYLIAYLCSVEIIPYILLYNGLVYLYNIDVINLLYGFEN